MKRVKRVITNSVNPLFEQWLLEWLKEAEEKNTQDQFTIGKALSNLRAYPLLLTSGKECFALGQFGPVLCTKLDKRLEEYKKSFTEEEWRQKIEKGSLTSSSSVSCVKPAPPSQKGSNKKLITIPGQTDDNEEECFEIAEIIPGAATCPQSQWCGSEDNIVRIPSPTFDDEPEPITSSRAKEKNCPGSASKVYVPKYRTGPYAILLALLNSSQVALTKEEIQESGQSLCDTSFTKPPAGALYKYTAWSSIKTLLEKNLVIQLKGHPNRYQLTSGGTELAERLQDNTTDIGDITPIVRNGGVKRSLESPLKLPSPRKRPIARKITTSTKNPPISSSGEKHSLESHVKLPSPKKRHTARKRATSTKNAPNSNIRNSDECNDAEFITLTSTAAGAVSDHRVQTCVGVSTADEGMKPCSSERAGADCCKNVFLAPGKFDIILLVDIHETEMRKKVRIQETVQELQKRGINCESRHLTVGDFVWICRDKTDASAELVLPYVVERKRLDDFGGSIKDGRYHEQKYRLKQSGLSELIYLVEKFGKDSQRFGLPLASIQQAAANTQIVEGFTVKYSQDHADSVRYLACFTKHLITTFRNKSIMSCAKDELGEFRLHSDLLRLMNFSEFNKESKKIKNFTVKEMLIKHLVQLSGVSVEKATVIADRYPTPSHLMGALTTGGEKLLADLKIGGIRRIGPATSTAIHRLYTKMVLE